MLGRPHAHHRLVDSTNERAKRLAASGAPHGTLVTADEQSAGRGRQGRRWEAPPAAALLASVVLRGLDRRDALLPLAAPVAACEACEHAAPGIRCSIKWPNDVWVGRRKLAGILIEGRPQEGWAVVGVGVNVTATVSELPEELRDRATSLAIEAGGERPTVAAVRDELLARLADWLDRPPERVLKAWRARDALTGRQVRWETGSGIAAGVDDRGALLVDTASGRRVLDAGEVHLGSDAAGGARTG